MTTSSSSTNISSSVNPEEALYLEEKLETATSRLERCQKSVKDYSKVMTDLANFSNLPRRQVLTPVCNGLAYFDAVVENTNSLMVLLGDGWFAERSSKQSVEIAGRRLDFLKEEEQMLKGQVRQVEETIKIANEESNNNNSNNHRKNNTSSYHHDQYEDEEDDDDTDSFESCDDLNLREIEDLEEEMLRDTRGGEWSSEVLHQKVRERKEAKRQRRLTEEALAQKTVAEIMMGKAAPKETEKGTASNNNSSKVPQHPGEIGIVEQLEMLNDIISKKNNTKKEMDDDDTNTNNKDNKKDSSAEKIKETEPEVKSKMTFSHQQPQTDQNQQQQQQLPDLIQPTTSINEDKQNNMNSTTTTTNPNPNNKETEIMIPLEEFNRRMAEINKNNQSNTDKPNNNTVADGTGGIVERRTQPVSSTSTTNKLTSSSSIVEKQGDTTATTAPPKKMSLFRQRKQGL